MYGMVNIECKVHMCKSMAEMDTESNTWRLTGFGSGFLLFGSRFGINSSDTAHL